MFQHLAYQIIPDKIFDNKSQMKNILQHVENWGKPKSLYPTG